MPGRQVNPDQRKHFFRLLAEGWTRSEAAARAGFSIRTAERLIASRNTGANASMRAPVYVDDIPPAQTDGHNPSSGDPTPAQVSSLLVPEPGPTPGLVPIPEPLRKSELTDLALDCLNDFARFRFHVLGRKSSPWQEDAADQARRRLATHVKEYVVVNAPPGGGKSTLFTHDIPLWLIARSRSIREFIGSGTQTTANSYTGRLRNTLERHIPMQAKDEDRALGLAVDATHSMPQLYGRFRPLHDPDRSNPPWSRSQFTVEQLGETSVDEKEATCTAFGMDSKFLGWRVNFIVWDDLVTKDTFRTQEAITAQRSWWLDEAQTRLEPGGLLILQGQRLNAEDLYRFCLDMEVPIIGDDEDELLYDLGQEELPTEKKYVHIVYKAHYEEHCKAKEDPRAHSRKSKPYDPNDANPGCLLDPVRLPWRELKSIMDQPLTNFRVVYQQEDVEPSEVLIPEVWINGGTDPETGIEYIGCKDLDRGIAQIPPNLVGTKISYVTVDPSPSNFWAIQWWMYVRAPDTPPLGGMRYLLDLKRAPMESSDFLDLDTRSMQYEGIFDEWVTRARILRMPIQYLIFEVNAAQKFVHQHKFMRTYLSSRNILFKPHTTGINKADAELGIGMLRSKYRNGQVRFPATPEAWKVVQPMYKELTNYPNWSTDDTIMANWFSEFQLPNLIGAENTIGSLYNDTPSWIRQGA